LHLAVTARAGAPGEWVLLQYRLPREPSTPRSAVWRRLRRLGVAQLSDGLVALPSDARTREQLEWVAANVREAVGTAGVWLARPASAEQEREIASAMTLARAQEYRAVRSEAEAVAGLADAERVRVARRLREELRRIRRRDFFPPAERDTAVAAVEEIAAGTTAADRTGEATTAAPGPA